MLGRRPGRADLQGTGNWESHLFFGLIGAETGKRNTLPGKIGGEVALQRVTCEHAEACWKCTERLRVVVAPALQVVYCHTAVGV